MTIFNIVIDNQSLTKIAYVENVFDKNHQICLMEQSTENLK